MCFVLYLAARVPPPLLPHAKYGCRDVNTKALREYDEPVRAHFTLDQVVYLGSDQGCGCGFRSTTDPDPGAAEYFASLPDYDTTSTQPNHDALAARLRQHFAGEEFVELYGCWDGDFSLPERGRFEVSVEDLTAHAFHFVQRGYYRVNLRAPGGDDGDGGG